MDCASVCARGVCVCACVRVHVRVRVRVRERVRVRVWKDQTSVIVVVRIVFVGRLEQRACACLLPAKHREPDELLRLPVAAV